MIVSQAGLIRSEDAKVPTQDFPTRKISGTEATIALAKRGKLDGLTVSGPTHAPSTTPSTGFDSSVEYLEGRRRAPSMEISNCVLEGFFADPCSHFHRVVLRDSTFDELSIECGRYYSHVLIQGCRIRKANFGVSYFGPDSTLVIQRTRFDSFVDFVDSDFLNSVRVEDCDFLGGTHLLGPPEVTKIRFSARPTVVRCRGRMDLDCNE